MCYRTIKNIYLQRISYFNILYSYLYLLSLQITRCKGKICLSYGHETESMTFRWVQDYYLLSLNRGLNLWRKQGQRYVTLLSSQTSSPPVHLFVKRTLLYRVRDCHHHWKHCYIQRCRTRMQCPCHISFLRHRLLLCTSVSNFTTSASLGSNDLSYRLSRLKNTLESLSKVVRGTKSEISSRIARLKPSANLDKNEASIKTAPIQDQKNKPVSTATVTLVPQTSQVFSTSTTLSPTSSSFRPSSSVQKQEIKNNNFAINNTNTESRKAAAPQTKSERTTSSDSSISCKQATPLFHPGSFTVNLDETYNYLAHHVNSYFGRFTLADQNKEEVKECFTQPSTFSHDQPNQNIYHISSVQESGNNQTSGSLSSPKKSLGQYLAYKPTVQAFVGNYIAPLVPKFRAEPKNALAESEKSLSNEESSKKMETAENKEQKAAEEKAKRLLLQREKVTSSPLC